MVPGEGSPAIDAGSAFGPTTDQRGLPRPADLPGVPNAADGSDIGAVEVQPPAAAGGGAGAGAPTGTVPVARPSVSRFDFSPNVIAVGRRATPVRGIARRGRFVFRLSGAAQVTITIEQRLRGRRRGRRCVRPRPGLRRRCTRFRRRGRLFRAGRAGANRVFFTGRIGRRALPAGRYRATITATNTGGPSRPRTTNFRVAAIRRTRR
jgi:hypothetical protein